MYGSDSILIHPIVSDVASSDHYLLGTE